jgi:hypothetical protein
VGDEVYSVRGEVLFYFLWVWHFDIGLRFVTRAQQSLKIYLLNCLYGFV